MRALGIGAVMVFGLALQAPAQQPAGGPAASQAARPPGPGGGFGRGPQFDPAVVERGKQAYVTACGFCHGSNARGAQGGPDLIRSVLVLDDENGRELGEFLKVGRPDKGMPKFEMSQQQVQEIATFLHQQVAAVANRGTYRILDILVGDAKAGEAFFNGVGKCHTCHSPTGDLKGIGAKYDPVTLQGRIVMPRGRGRFGGGRGRGPSPPESPESQVTVAVTLPSGESFSGALVRITDFDVTLRDSSGVLRSFKREEDIPKVQVKDPLQAHLDLLAVWKDSDIHNMTAYLMTLK